MSMKNVIEELINVHENAPLEPGDTISHDTAQECYKRGWIIRNADSNWILTDAGKEYVNKIYKRGCY